jgi:hypothetical protein
MNNNFEEEKNEKSSNFKNRKEKERNARKEPLVAKG